MIKTRKKLVVLSGAGVSAESGIATFRDANGLWEGHDILEVASPEGWNKNPGLVLNFYNQRRRQLKLVASNNAHQLISQLEQYYDVCVITQNVDDLHERAGSQYIIHLHGELLKAQSSLDKQLVYPWHEDIKLGDTCQQGAQLRPFIVWFGEDVPNLPKAAFEVEQADVVIVIGTSMQVYPAASLVDYAKPHADIYYIDPTPSINYSLKACKSLKVIKATAQQGMAKVYSQLVKN
ncbi:SIR2 family NAD-dependent protein deacylase [Thalassotalea ganghwensis]